MATWRLAILAAWAALAVASAPLPVSAQPDDGMLEVAVHRAVRLSLGRPARHVVVGDPAIADVTVQSPRTIFVFGKKPGATSLTIMDGKDSVLMERTVVVGGGPDAIAVLHGTGKNVPPGGRVMYTCGERCAHALSSADTSSGSVPAPASPPAQ